jgi:formylglycine-generating enzyme required for sulfatase activity
MGQNARGGITRSGTSSNFTYAVKPFMEDKPVNFVNWFSAARFCNWLHNGKQTGPQGPGTTEDGAYTLTGPTNVTLPGSHPIHGVNGRNAGAKFHVPSENEWYKAAYHQPAAQGGDADNYWFYPTQSNSNSPPTVATADGTGRINNDSANIANYDNGADWNEQDGNVTAVGSGGLGSASYYGAYDMGGNVAEWTEESASPTERVTRGGSWSITVSDLGAPLGVNGCPTCPPGCDIPNCGMYIGFRIASP